MANEVVNTFQLTADIKTKVKLTIPTVTQNDTIIFEIKISDRGVEWPAEQLSLITTSTLASTRPDGQVVVRGGTAIGNSLVFSLDSVETAVTGKVKAVIQLYSENTRVSTISFTYDVVVDPTGPSYEPLASEMTLIETVLYDGPQIIADAVLATTDAQTAAAYATQVAESNVTTFLPAVATVEERDTTYPTPSQGDVVRVTSEAKTYRYVAGTGWVITDAYDATAIDGLASDLAQNLQQTEQTNVNMNKTLLDVTGSLKETVTTITTDSNHNAFPCMIRFNNLFHVYYRTGTGHAAFDGVIKVKTSSDGVTWSAETVVIQEVDKDYRDPGIILFNGQLVLKTFYRLSTGEFKTCIFTSADGVTFGNKVELPSPSSLNAASRGNMTIKDGVLYMMNYVASGNNYLFLVKTTDLLTFDIVNPLVKTGGNEASIASTTDKLICIFRQTKLDSTARDWDVGCGYIESFDNGVTWTNFKELPFGNHCPSILKTLDGNSDTLLVLFRNTRYQDTQNRTHVSLVRLDTKGNLLSRDYSLFWATGVWDVGYGDIVEYAGNTYIVYYYWNGTGNVVVKKFDMYVVRALSQYNEPASVNIPNTLEVTHNGTVNNFKMVTGFVSVTGDGTAKKQFTINFTGVPYAFFYTPVDANGLYKANHVSAVSGGVTGVISKDNGATFSTALNVYYMIFVK